MNRLLKTIYLGLSASFALTVFSLFSFANLSTSMSARAAANDAAEQTTTVNTQASSDAIAIRVFANDSHLSARDWFYQNISTKRSLQSLAVDGYDAVRDNRTVYVAASNVVACNDFSQGGGDCLKPIMAVISFNQNISTETVDIFGQILNNWKFNHNLNNRPKTCSNNITICRDNSECHSGGDICSTAKEKVIRDTKRLITLASIKTKLEDYRLKFQHYPSFEAGSYLPNKTLSVWPSWQKTFATKLGSALPVDPINKLGSCPGDGVNQTTCWNERTKRFYNDQGLEDLPDYSHVIRYEFNNSNDYNLCALFETTYSNILDSQNSCQTNYRNTGPVISCRNIVGLPNKPFTGYAEVFDNEGDLITSATINTTTLAGWDPITVSITPDRRYVKIISNRSGAINRYNVDITVKDSLNNQSTVSCPITIGGNRFSLSYSAGEGGTISGARNQVVDQGGSGTEVKAIPQAGKYFASWSDNSSNNTNSRTDTNVSSNIAATAIFKTNPSYTLSFDVNDGDTLANPSKSVTQGLPVGELPTPTKSGCAFGGWNTQSKGNGTNYTAATVYNNNGNLTLYAKWSRNSFALKYTAGVGGKVNNTTTVTQTVSINGSGTEVTATANSGYEFAGWSDNSSTNPIRRETNVTRDYDAMAIFAVRPWQCGDDLVDNRPGLTGSKTYGTVQIGTQCWMKENLKWLPTTGTNSISSGASNSPKYFIYDLKFATTSGNAVNNLANYNTYGVMYNWAAASNACPTGWHLPKSSEYMTLINHLGGYNLSTAQKMKSVGNWDNWYGYTCNNGNNSSGFNVLPSGEVIRNGVTSLMFNGLGDRTRFWTNTKIVYDAHLTPNNARAIGLGCFLFSADEPRGFAHPVRCVQGAGSSPDEVNGLNAGHGEGEEDDDDVVEIMSIIFDGDGGQIRVGEQTFANHAKTVTPNTRVGDMPTATKGSLIFDGWYTGKNGTGTKYTSETVFRGDSDVILYANWVESSNKFVLSYLTDNGGFILEGEAIQNIEKGENGQPVKVKPYDGFKFVKWSDGVTDNPRTDVKVDKDIEVKAIFEKDEISKVKVTFYTNNGSEENKVVELDWNTSLTSTPTPERNGYDFIGWHDHPTDEKAVKIDRLPWGPITFNLSYYARWKVNTPNNFTVTFNKNGGNTEANPVTISIAKGLSLSTLPSQPVRDHYTFKNWNTKADGTGTTFTATTPVTANITVYAQWTANKYSVIFDDNFDGGASVTRDNIEYLSRISPLPQPINSRPNYYFAGVWNTQADGNGTDFTANTPVTGNITLYAKWAVVPVVTVAFDDNYSGGVAQLKSVYKGTSVDELIIVS